MEEARKIPGFVGCTFGCMAVPSEGLKTIEQEEIWCKNECTRSTVGYMKRY